MDLLSLKCNRFVCGSDGESHYVPKKCVKDGRFKAMLDGYACECMVLVINIHYVDY